MASYREPIPAGIFVSDQLQPSVRYGESEWVGDKPHASITGADPPGPNIAPPLSGADPETNPFALVVTKPDKERSVGHEPQNDWRTLYLDFLVHEKLPADKTEAHRLARQAKLFVIIDELL